MAHYEELLKRLYTEPKEEEIISTFLSLQQIQEPTANTDQEEDVEFDEFIDEPQNKRKKSAKTNVRSHNIRDMFSKVNKKKGKNIDDVGNNSVAVVNNDVADTDIVILD